MMTARFIESLRRAQAQLPRATWESLRAAVGRLEGSVTERTIATLVGEIANRDLRWELQEALAKTEKTMWIEIAAVMVAIDTVKVADPLQIIWSGPSSRRFAARRIDQVLYDLLAQAKRRAWIVTFSAHRIERLCRELLAAHQRKVQVTLLLETEEGSAGQLSHDAQKAFQGLPLHEIEVLHWPREARSINAAGRPGKLHAKCAVIDDTIVIGSANLTDDAFNRNMELGVAAKDPETSEALVQHFRELEMQGVLHRIGNKGTPGQVRASKKLPSHASSPTSPKVTEALRALVGGLAQPARKNLVPRGPSPR